VLDLSELEPEISSLSGMRSKEKIFSFLLMFKYAGSISGFGIYKNVLSTLLNALEWIL